MWVQKKAEFMIGISVIPKTWSNEGRRVLPYYRMFSQTDYKDFCT